jgi:hypothetical protein
MHFSWTEGGPARASGGSAREPVSMWASATLTQPRHHAAPPDRRCSVAAQQQVGEEHHGYLELQPPSTSSAAPPPVARNSYTGLGVNRENYGVLYRLPSGPGATYRPASGSGAAYRPALGHGVPYLHPYTPPHTRAESSSGITHGNENDVLVSLQHYRTGPVVTGGRLESIETMRRDAAHTAGFYDGPWRTFNEVAAKRRRDSRDIPLVELLRRSQVLPLLSSNSSKRLLVSKR